MIISKVSIVKGEDRKENIINAISLIKADIAETIKTKKSKQLFIKINAIDSNFPLACTHIDAIDAVLSIFYDRFDEIILGDNSFVFRSNKLKWDNLVNVIKQVKSDLCILDAYEGMEGEGPLFGTNIQIGIAMCS